MKGLGHIKLWLILGTLSAVLFALLISLVSFHTSRDFAFSLWIFLIVTAIWPIFNALYWKWINEDSERSWEKEQTNFFWVGVSGPFYVIYGLLYVAKRQV